MKQSLYHYLDIIEKKCNEKPFDIALTYNNEHVTYGELDSYSNRVANYINEILHDQKTIGINFYNHIYSIICILGILKSGKSYFSINATLPSNRILYSLEQSGTNYILSDRPEDTDYNNTIDISDLLNYKNQKIKIYPKSTYVVYTSGTTGKPKGISINDSILNNLIKWQVEKSASISSKYKTLSITPFSFDVSFQEIISTLCLGGELVLVDFKTRRNFEKLANFIHEKEINRLFLSPVIFNEIASVKKDDYNFMHLKEVNIAGEQLKITPNIKNFIKNNHNCIFVNQYGPSETHVCTYHVIENIDEEIVVPIGKPIENIYTYIDKKPLYLTDYNQEGELYIGSKFIAPCYLDRDNSSFFYDENLEIYFYKTGDLVKLNTKNELVFLDRIDSQIKVRGYRVELEEIEKIVYSNFNIVNANVIVVNVDTYNKKLALFIEKKKEVKYSADEVKRVIKINLPNYMVPQYVEFLEKMPRTDNNKVNKRELSAILESKYTKGVVDNNYKNTKEEIKSIIRNVLNLSEGININENLNLYDIGIDSILVPKVINKINGLLDAKLNIEDLYKYTTIAKLDEFLNYKINEAPNEIDTNNGSNDIAIIGMSGLYPDSNNLTEFWDNLCNGHLSVRSVRKNNHTLLIDSKIDNSDTFDNEFFNISEKDAKLMDPQQRKFFEVAWKALEDSGYSKLEDEKNIGVFAGAGESNNLHNDKLNSNFNSMEGLRNHYNNANDYIATRFSYLLGLTGPSINVQSACSTSLVAVHLACQSLKNNECKMAIAGSSTLFNGQDTSYSYEEGMVFSKEGRIRPFSEDASGIVFSDGVAAVVLKDYSEALKDNDHIYAIIKGSFINNDGNTKLGFTAPSSKGQIEVMQKCYQHSNIDPMTINYIETHGTGTKVGDKIEISAIDEVFEPKKDHKCYLGSVKSNIGHNSWTSGITGLIKSALILENKVIPPTIGIKDINKELLNGSSKFILNTHLIECQGENLKRAAVNSFGIGGTNAHIVLEEPPQKEIEESNSGRHILAFSANNNQSLRKQITDFSKVNLEKYSMEDICYTMNKKRRVFPVKKSFTFDDIKDLQRKLNQYIASKHEGFYGSPNVAFVFPGNGSHYKEMGMHLYKKNEFFRMNIDICERIIRKYSNLSLFEILNEEPMSNTTKYSQLAIFCIEISLGKLWIELGVFPSVLIGHSMGEYAAAHLANVMTLEDSIKILLRRGELIESIPNESEMLSIRTTTGNIEDIVDKYDLSLRVSVYNSPKHIVITDKKDKIRELKKILTKDKNIIIETLKIDVAGHTKELSPIVEEFRKEFQSITLKEPTMPIISGMSGNFIKNGELVNPDYWCSQIVNPVHFDKAIDKCLSSYENLIFLETGPGASLLGVIMEFQDDSNILLLPTMRENINDYNQLLNSISKVYDRGIEINWNLITEDANNVSLPSYHFQNKQHLLNSYNMGNKDFYKISTIESSGKSDYYCDDIGTVIILGHEYLSYYVNNENVQVIRCHTISELLNILDNNSSSKRFEILLTYEQIEFNLNSSDINEKLGNFIFLLKNLMKRSEIDSIIVCSINPIKNSELLFNIFKSIIRTANLEDNRIIFKTVEFDCLRSNFIDTLLEEKSLPDIHAKYISNKRYVERVSNCIIPNFNKESDNNIKNGVFIVTGGYGGIGKLIVQWLSDKGAKEVIIIARRKKWENDIYYNKNTKISNVLTDISDYESLEKVFKSFKKQGINIRGIFHLAGVVSDSPIIKIRDENLKDVFDPKIKGTLNLHWLSVKYEKQLKYFVCFSSTASIFGNAAQSNHSAANAFIDSIMIYRQNNNLPGYSINWGAWDEVGYLKNNNSLRMSLQKKGFNPIAPINGLKVLECTLQNNQNIAYSPMNWENFMQFFNIRHKYYPDNLELNSIKHKGENEKDFICELASLKQEYIDEKIAVKVSEILENILGIYLNEKERNRNFYEIGMDSLSSIELRNTLQKIFDININIAEINELTTINKVIAFIKREVKDLKEHTSKKYISKQEDSLKIFNTKEISYQQERWKMLIDKKYGERVCPIIYHYQFNKEAFVKALKRVISRHDTLRTYFDKQSKYAIKKNNIDKKNLFMDIRGESEFNQKKVMDKTISDMYKNIPNIYTDVPWDVKCVIIDNNTFIVLLLVQHIDFDGSSISIFADDLDSYYSNYLNNKSEFELPQAISYESYTNMQKSQDLSLNREFFKGVFGNLEKTTQLDGNVPHELGTPRISRKVTINTPFNLKEKIESYSKSYNVSSFSVLFMAYSLLVSEITGENTVVISSIINGRNNSNYNSTIGPFTQPFPLKIIVNKEDILSSIKYINYMILEINDRSNYPVKDLINFVPAFSDFSTDSYFSDVGINFVNFKKANKTDKQNYEMLEILGHMDQKLFSIYNTLEYNRIPGLHLVIQQKEKAFQFNFYYHKERFSFTNVEEWSELYIKILERLLN